MKTKLFTAIALALLATLTPASAQNNAFKLATTINASGTANPAEVIATDVNGDARVDLIVAGTVYTNSGKGVFGSALTFNPINLHSNGFVAADVNRDGWVDIVALTNLTTAPYTESIVVYTNSGHLNSYPYYGISYGVASSTASVGNENSPGSGSLVNAGDVLGNGLMNLFYFNANSNSVCLFTNNGTGVFGSNTTFSLKLGLPVAADVNRDGSVDFISPGTSNSLVYVFTNNGAGVFGSNAALNVKFPVNVFTADVNGDGWVDLIVESVTNYLNNPFEPITTLSVWTNNGSGTFGSNTSFTVGNVGELVTDLKAAPLFGDGNLHLALAVRDVYHGNASYLMVYTNNGLGGFGSNFITTSLGFLSPASVAVADLNGDGALDLVSANYYSSGSGSVTVFTNTGNGIQTGSFLSNSASALLSSNTCFLTAADLYRNGKQELIASGTSNSYAGPLPVLLVLTNNSNGVFGSNAMVSRFSPYGGNPYQVASAPIMADIFGNGSPAMLFLMTNYNGGLVMVLTNNGAGVFGTNSAITSSTFGYFNMTPLSLTVADVNRDGKPDLILTASLGSEAYLEVLTNNGAGGFATNTVINLYSLTIYTPLGLQLAVADVNHDGRPDLAIAYSYGNYSQLTIFTNINASGAGPFYSSASGFYTSYLITAGAIPSALVAADVNGDGNVDFVIANNNNPGTLSVMTNSGYNNAAFGYVYKFGLNSSPVVGAYPHALVAADVNGDGKLDLISANWGLLTNTTDARGPLNWGTLSVLTNNGTGGFTNPATFSVGRGPTALLAADLNGDGQLDLITANATSFTNQTSLSGTNWYGRGGNTLSVLFNISNYVNTVVLSTTPTDSPITYGQTLTNVNLTGGGVTNEAGGTVNGTFTFATNSLPGAGTTNLPVTFTPTPPTDYQPITFNVSVTVSQLVAVLKGTRVYDGTTNVLHNFLSVSNKVGTDNVAVNGGSVGLDTANVGTNIFSSTNGLTLGGSTAVNYTLAGVSGAVVITKAANAVALTSSMNPSALGVGLYFTATLPAYATGSVAFYTNAIPLETDALAGGTVTTASAALLPLGSNPITAVYLGDPNNQAVTNNLAQIVSPPVFTAPVMVPGGVTLSGSLGKPGQTYFILASTDMTLPPSQWLPIYTNTFDFSGSYSFTNPLTPDPGVYFILEIPNP